MVRSSQSEDNCFAVPQTQLEALIVEMNPYSAFLDDLPGSQRPTTKPQLISLKEVLHPHICQVLEVVDLPIKLSVKCEPPGTSMLQLYQAHSIPLDDSSLTRQFLGIVAGLSKTQVKVETTQRITHGRLSLEALFLNEQGTMKVVGFGTFNGVPEHSPGSCSRCLQEYRSPEIKEDQIFNVYKADLWALGICFLKLAASCTLTGQETIEELVTKVNRLGPKLSHVLKLVFKPESERADCVSFKEQSGYCQVCWNNLDQGGELCGACPPARPKEKNPLSQSGQAFPPDSVIVPQVSWRHLRVDVSPELPRCRLCQRDLKKINEKDICRLCLIKEKAAAGNRPLPVLPGGQKSFPQGSVPGAGTSNLSQPKAGPSPPVAAEPMKSPVQPWKSEAQVNPNKPKTVHFVPEAADKPRPPGSRSGNFPNLSNSGQPQPVEVRGESYCITCRRLLSRRSRNQVPAPGYDQFCSDPECVVKYMAYLEIAKVPDEISCMECTQPCYSEWIKLPCQESHCFCSNNCALDFVKRSMGPSVDTALVICPQCKAAVPQELIQQWRDGQGNQPFY